MSIKIQVFAVEGDPNSKGNVRITSPCGLDVYMHTNVMGVVEIPFLKVDYLGPAREDPKMIPASVGLAKYLWHEKGE